MTLVKKKNLQKKKKRKKKKEQKWPFYTKTHFVSRRDVLILKVVKGSERNYKIIN